MKLDKLASNATEGASQSVNNTASDVGQAASNATEGASQSVNNTASDVGQAASNASASGSSTNATQSKNPLEMLMNLFKGNK